MLFRSRQVGTATVSPTATAVISAAAAAAKNVSPGIAPRNAGSTVDMLAVPPVAKPQGALQLRLLMLLSQMGEVAAELTEAQKVHLHGVVAADNSPTSSSIFNRGLETSEKPKPLSEQDELAALREGLAILHAGIAEQAGDKHCETLFDIAAVSVLERGLLALERVWVSEGLSCA